MFEVLFWVTLVLSITAVVLAWLRRRKVMAERDAAFGASRIAALDVRDAEERASIPVPRMPDLCVREMLPPISGEWGVLYPTGVLVKRGSSSLGTEWRERTRVIYFTDLTEARADVEASEEEQNKLAIERYREECDQYERLCKAKAMRDQAGEVS